MADDPHDATWIPPTKKVVWCPIHQEDMETCRCGRDNDNVLPVMILIAIVLVILALLTILLYGKA